MRIRTAVVAITCGVLAGACSQPQPRNAPPGIVDLCREAIRSEAEREPLPQDDIPSDQYPGSAERAIEQAASAEHDAAAGKLEDWPDDALLYRCLAANGVTLTPQQAKDLANWQQRTTEARKQR